MFCVCWWIIEVVRYAWNNRKFNNQDRALIVNTTSLGLNSPWLEHLSQKTQGYYNQIDKESIENNQEDLG